MIKTQDLKLQIDELTKQNDMVLIELEQVKQLLVNSDSSQSTQGGGQSQGQNSGQNSGGDAGGQQASGSNQQGQQGQTQNAGQAANQGQNAGQAANQAPNAGQAANQGQNAGQGSQGSQGDNGQQASDLAYELLKIKDMVEKLEQKTSQYVSSQTNGALTEKDVVNLVLSLMNGMVDWASEFVSSKSASNGQVQ